MNDETNETIPLNMEDIGGALVVGINSIQYLASRLVALARDFEFICTGTGDDVIAESRDRHREAAVETLRKVDGLYQFLADYTSNCDAVDEDDMQATEGVYARMQRVLKQAKSETTKQ